MATAITIMTIALRTIRDQSADTMDNKGDVIGAGRRLERIIITASTALDGFDAMDG